MSKREKALNAAMNADLMDSRKGYPDKDGKIDPVNFVEYPNLPTEYITIHGRVFLINTIDRKYYPQAQ